MEKTYRDYGPDEIDEIIAITTDGGPFEDDLFYLIFAGENLWRVSMFEAENIYEWFAKFPDFDFEKAIRASASTQNRRFILWSKTGPRGIGEKTEDVLAKRFESLLASANSKWGLVSNDLSLRLRVVEEVIENYQESHRHYHGLAHIKHCLWELDQLPDDCLKIGSEGVDVQSFDVQSIREKIELAIWFHDVIYNPRSKTNEHDSAEFFRTKMRGNFRHAEGEKVLQEVSQMIELSNHREPVLDRGSALAYFLDIDMAILGRPVIHYNEYAQNVGLEYAHVPSTVYSHYRKKFLNAVLRHGAFQTEWFQGKYKAQSIENMKSEFKDLHARWIPPWKMVEV